MDFADIRTYPPNQYPGVVVLRLGRQDKPHLMVSVAGLIPWFSTELLERRLWIVEEDKLRIRERGQKRKYFKPGPFNGNPQMRRA